MKKLVVGLLLLFAAGILFNGCRSSQKCAAYGEAHKYQKEVRY